VDVGDVTPFLGPFGTGYLQYVGLGIKNWSMMEKKVILPINVRVY